MISEISYAILVRVGPLGESSTVWQSKFLNTLMFVSFSISTGTTKKPKESEQHGIDHNNFVIVDEFNSMEKKEELQESGVYESNYCSTPKPPGDSPSSTTAFPTYTQSPIFTGDIPHETLKCIESISSSGSEETCFSPHVTVPQNYGPLLSNREIADTEYNETYFVE